MLVFGNVFIYLLLLVMCDHSLTFVTDDLMFELYSKYISAVSNDNFTVATRRLFKRNREYEIHITKLKEVNGYKKHNLLVKENLRNGGIEYIYINNPVESKTPKAYLTFEEFKNALTDRVLAQRKEFTFQRTTKNVQQQTDNKKPKTTNFFKNILRYNIAKEGQQKATTSTSSTSTTSTSTTSTSTTSTSTTSTSTTSTTKRERIVNVIRKVNLKTNNVDTINYNKTVNKNVITIKKYLDKEKITFSATTDLVKNNVHESNVTMEKVAENNITLHLIATTEAYKNNKTEISINSQDNNLDTTEPMTENTKTEETISHSPSTHFEERELLSDNTTVLENIEELQTENSEILTNIEVTTESFKVKQKPRRKKTTKSYPISHQKRRSTLGRPLVFFGSR